MASWKPREIKPVERLLIEVPPEKLNALLAEIAGILYNYFSRSDFLPVSSLETESGSNSLQGNRLKEDLECQ